MKVIGAHISADNVVGVFLSLVDAVNGFVSFFFFVAALFGSVFIDWGADDSDFDSEGFDLFNLAVSDKFIVFEFIGGFELGVDDLYFWAWIGMDLLFFLR